MTPRGRCYFRVQLFPEAGYRPLHIQVARIPIVFSGKRAGELFLSFSLSNQRERAGLEIFDALNVCDHAGLIDDGAMSWNDGVEIEILLAIGRIEGKLQVYESLSQRVSSLERCQWWLKGGWAAVAMFVWLFRGSSGR